MWAGGTMTGRIENGGKRVARLWSMWMVMMASYLFLFLAPMFAQSGKPVSLKCESLTTPLGMDAEKPLLQWKIEDSRAGARQTAYQIQVASSAEALAGGKGDVWDSGRVESANSAAAQYGGPALEASKRYYWRVLVWDQDGKALVPSEISWWETGLLKQ